MIEPASGDIVRADAEALVNTVNCVGVMGRGIALQFRKAFPENFKAYKTACDSQQLVPGMMLVHELPRLTYPRYIINFPTKRHWKGTSRIEDIEDGLKALVEEVRNRGIRSVAVPPLGCGLGGLDWKDVRPKIEQAFRDLVGVRVLLFEPDGPPVATEMAKGAKVPQMTVGRAALLGLMQRYLAAAMDPFVSLLEVHKLMYFMQETGEPLRLRYTKAAYGPPPEGASQRRTLSPDRGRGGSGGRGGAGAHREGSYHAIAERLFGQLNFDQFLFEYDSDAAGSFDAIRFIPKEKTAVLGLVSNNGQEVETTD